MSISPPYPRPFEHVPLGLYRTTRDGQFLEVNPALVQMLRYPDQATLLAARLDELYVDPTAYQRRQALMQLDGSVRWLFAQLRRWDGTLIWVSESAQAVRDREGNIEHYEGSLEDITEREQMQAAQREQQTLAETMRDIANALSNTLDLDEAMERILVNVGRVVPHDTANIMLIEEGVARVIRCKGYGDSNQDKVYLDQRLVVAETPSLRQALESGRPVLIPDVRAFPGWIDLPGTSWIRSYLCAPISAGGRVIGFLNLDSATPGFFTELHAMRLRTFAFQAAIALNNARVYSEATRRANEFAALYSISGELATQQILTALLQTVVESATALLDVPAGAIYLYDTEHRDLEIMTVKGMPSPQDSRLRLGEGIAGHVAQTRRPLIVNDCQAWAQRSPQSPALPLRAMLLAPMLYGGELIGVIGVGETGSSSRRFTEADELLLSLLAVQAASAVRNARLIEETRVRADQLSLLYDTGLALNSERDPQAQLELLITLAAKALRADRADFFRHDAERQTWQLEVGIGYDEETFAALKRLAPALQDEQGTLTRVARTRQPLNLADVSTDPGWITIDPAIRSGLWVPVERDGQLRGILGVLSVRPGSFTAHDERLLVMFANQSAVALENARLFQAEREQRELAETLREVGGTLASTLDTDTVLDRLLEQVSRVVPNDTANVMLIEGDQVRIVRGRGYEQVGVNEISTAAHPMASLPNLVQMLLTGKPICIGDVQADQTWVRRYENETEVLRSYAGAPMCVRGKVIGFLNVGSQTPGFFSWQHADRLLMFANQAGIALENARLFSLVAHEKERLQESQAQLIQAEKMGALGRLVASIAHEINNPLQAVQGCLSLIHEEVESERRQERIERYAVMAENEIERLTNIVRRLRDFYRPARQERRPTDVQVILESVLALTGKQLQHSNITVESNWTSGLPLIQANPDYVRQVFLNLIVNAIDAMSAKGGTLRVSTALDELPHSERQASAVRIEIGDTGEGIPPEALPRIFEPFFTGKENGTGLGLSISYGIIEAHNGRITVESQMGHGTTFTIWLPVGESG